MTKNITNNIQVKKIGGKEYLYVRDSVYINHGKVIQKYKSLGPKKFGLEIGKKLEKFGNDIEQFEIETRSKYWEHKIINNKAFSYIPLRKLEELRTKLCRRKQTQAFLGEFAMDMAFVTDFIYNSNKIEGSRLPKEAVKDKIEQGAKGNDEVSNSIRAIDYFKQYPLPCILGRNYSLGSLIKGQKILFAHDKGKQGLRKEPYIVGESTVLAHDEIEQALRDLFKWYKDNEYKIYPPELAFIFHFRFERIHPFPDGNGRIGRILMNNILKRHRYHPIIVWDNNRAAYFSAFKKATEGYNIDYIKFMIEQYRITYDIYIKKLGDAFSLEQQFNNLVKPSRSE